LLRRGNPENENRNLLANNLVEMRAKPEKVLVKNIFISMGPGINLTL
jgi:hypothetical protein